MPYRNLLVHRPRSETLAVFLGPAEVLAFDGEGRLRHARLDGRQIRRGLEGKVLERGPVDPGGEGRRFLTQEEADARLEEAHGRVREAAERGVLSVVSAEDLDGRELREVEPVGREEILGRIHRWNAGRYRDDVARCRSVYAPVGILPPDRYGSLVVQATTGCSFNGCRFCESYVGVPFHAREPGELREHVQEVRGYLGRGIGVYHSLFLGSANALLLPTDRLEEILRILGEELPEGAGPSPAQGVHAFVDAFSGPPRAPEEHARLAALGLRRVYLGLETGSDALRGWLGKPGRAGDYVDLVRNTKAGGLSVAVMVLAWAGGEEHAGEHVRATGEALREMGLDGKDTVFLSPLVLPRGRAGGDTVFGETPLDDEGRARQLAALRACIPGGPRIRRYDISEFLY